MSKAIKTSAKNRVKQMIKNKTLKRKKYRKALAKEYGIEKIIKDFIIEFDKLRISVLSASYFDIQIDNIVNKFQQQVQLIDRNAKIVIHWINEDNISSWDQIAVNGVSITFSEEYCQENNIEHPEIHINTGHIFMDSLYKD